MLLSLPPELFKMALSAPNGFLISKPFQRAAKFRHFGGVAEIQQEGCVAIIITVNVKTPDT
ncbi:MAG: hypothetical protein PHO08_03885 [Methylococcales bacterium]|nr:hypothetical protein [Methylococcales bacterium]MDD5632570.1 hypothetical protein [Methylococcales bacterium]